MTGAGGTNAGRGRTRDSDTREARGKREWEGGRKSEEEEEGGVWKRSLAGGGESGVSVIGEREIVRPHCFLGSPSS